MNWYEVSNRMTKSAGAYGLSDGDILEWQKSSSESVKIPKEKQREAAIPTEGIMCTKQNISDDEQKS